MSVDAEEAAKREVVGAIRLLIEKHTAATQEPITRELLEFHLDVLGKLEGIVASLTR